MHTCMHISLALAVVLNASTAGFGQTGEKAEPETKASKPVPFGLQDLFGRGPGDATSGDPDAISQILKKNWITKKSVQPLSSQSAGCIFKNPRGQRAGQLIEQAGLKGTRVGGAEISDRHANFIVTHPGAKSSDVLRLIDLIRSKISEQFGVHLESEIKIW